MREPVWYECEKCGKRFMRMEGGIVPTTPLLKPLCPKCEIKGCGDTLKKITDIFK